MMTFSQLHPLFERALDDAGARVARAALADLRRPTPCTDWDLGELVGHMIGQNVGFATAVREGDAPLTEYASPVLTADEIPTRWTASADQLRAAFRTASPNGRVRLAEFDIDVSVTTAIGMQLLDCAVHAWDLATALGGDYRPTDAIMQVVGETAQTIAARPGGTPGVFAPPRETTGADPWADALGLLGRPAVQSGS